MPEVEIYFHDFYYLDPTERFLFHVQVTRYQSRIEIIENISSINENANAFNDEYIVPLINERGLTVICHPESDIFDLD